MAPPMSGSAARSSGHGPTPDQANQIRACGGSAILPSCSATCASDNSSNRCWTPCSRTQPAGRCVQRSERLNRHKRLRAGACRSTAKMPDAGCREKACRRSPRSPGTARRARKSRGSCRHGNPRGRPGAPHRTAPDALRPYPSPSSRCRRGSGYGWHRSRWLAGSGNGCAAHGSSSGCRGSPARSRTAPSGCCDRPDCPACHRRLCLDSGSIGT